MSAGTSSRPRPRARAATRLVLHRYVLRLFLQYFVGILAAVLAIYLVADFSDRVKAFLSRPFIDVAELYWNKLLTSLLQLGPAAMLLAAGAAVSTLRKRGELTAMSALAFSPRVLYWPIGLTALVFALGLIVFDERVVTRASAQVDEITVSKFNRWGDWRFYFRPKQWFRSDQTIFFLRSGSLASGFEDVSIFELTRQFRLASRIDARKMTHITDDLWELTDVSRRRFRADGTSPLERLPTLRIHLGLKRSAFDVRQGRPEQMRVRELLQQIRVRGAVGLPIQQLRLALHNRFAYPLTGVAAALLAIGLALRSERKGHLTVALLEGVGIAMALWGMMVVGKSLVMSERVPAAVAAWAPSVVLLLAATFVWLRYEGRFLARRA